MAFLATRFLRAANSEVLAAETSVEEPGTVTGDPSGTPTFCRRCAGPDPPPSLPVSAGGRGVRTTHDLKKNEFANL